MKDEDYIHDSNPIVGKLLKLKYRINDAYREPSQLGKSFPESETKADKSYVMSLISDIRKHGFTKLAPEDGHCCNGLWRKYAG
jgi:hypothetical protein